MQRLVPRRVEEVEEPDVVRARVRAIAGADAAVVDLRVEAVLGVMAGVGRTDRLARRVVAVLAHDGAELERRLRELAFPVALDADPVLGAPARRLLCPDGRDVVLGVAGGDTGAAPGAAIEVDGHSPVRHAATAPS